MENSFFSFIKSGPTKGIRPVLRRSSLICLMVTALLISGFALSQTVSAQNNKANQHWVGTWSTSPQTQEGFIGPPPAPPSVNNETLRQIVRITIGGPEVSADEIIAGYKQIIERLHAKGLKILVGTILPFKAFAYWSAAREVEREAVNEWIRTSNMHDGVVDFDQVIRDPNDPQRMLPAFDSGDNLHPSAAGYAAMGAEAEKALLAPGRGHIRLR